MKETGMKDITCEACVGKTPEEKISAHALDDSCRHGRKVVVWHLNALTKEERDELNGSDQGWSHSPRFERYADIAHGFDERLIEQVGVAWKLGEYHVAATVFTDSLDWAFHQTNNISHVWNLNEDVEAHTDITKSTSVGDLMFDGEDWFVVAPIGFTKINLEKSS
jgi:hypothetical protein